MKTSSQTALKVLSIIGIVVGAIIAVSGIVLTVGANGFAMSQASSSGAGVAVLGTIGGVVLIVAGAFNVVVGVFGVRGANDPSKIGVFWVLCIIGIVFNALGLIMEATGSGISDRHSVRSRSIHSFEQHQEAGLKPRRSSSTDVVFHSREARRR